MTTTEIVPPTEMSTLKRENGGTTLKETTSLESTTVPTRETTVEQRTIPTTAETTTNINTEPPTTVDMTTEKTTTLKAESRVEVTEEPKTEIPKVTTTKVSTTTAEITTETTEASTTTEEPTTIVTTEKEEEAEKKEVENEEGTTENQDETTTIESTTVEETTLLTTTKASTKKKRSLVDYYIARYYDDNQDITSVHLPHFPRREPSKEINYSFLVNGKFEETGVHFMTYDVVLPFYYIRNLNSLALKFPLDSPKYYLLLILPVDTFGIHKLICDLDATISLKEIVLQMRPTFVRAVIPSFMLRGFVVLTSTLQKVSHCLLYNIIVYFQYK